MNFSAVPVSRTANLLEERTSVMLNDSAPVICNHGPLPMGNRSDFDYSSSKSLLEAPHCGDKQLVKPLLLDPALLYYFIATVLEQKQKTHN